MLLPVYRQEPFDVAGTTAHSSGIADRFGSALKHTVLAGLSLLMPLVLSANNTPSYLQSAKTEQPAATQKRHDLNHQLNPPYALPVSRFLIGTESSYSHSMAVKESGFDANRPGLEGFKAWMSQLLKQRSTGLDWETLQELHALYQEALMGDATNLSLMNMATKAILGEQDGAFKKIKFLNEENQQVAELHYTDDGILYVRPQIQKSLYSVEEAPLSLQKDWVKGIGTLRIASDGRLVIEQEATSQDLEHFIDNVLTDLQRNYPQAVSHVRMGNHEFGIQLSGATRRFQTGNLHLHIEFTLPQEQKLISYTIPINANILTENHKVSTDRLIEKYQTLFEGIYTNVNWEAVSPAVWQTLSGAAVDELALPNPKQATSYFPAYQTEQEALLLSRQLQKSASPRISASEKQALKAETQTVQTEQQHTFPVLDAILEKAFPFVLMKGPQVPSEQDFISTLTKSFPMIGYEQASVLKNLSLLRPNQENMVLWYAHGTIVNGRHTRNHRWISNVFDNKGKISYASLQEILNTIEKSDSELTHLVLWSCLSGQALEDFMKLTREHPSLTERVNLYIPGGYYELRTNDFRYSSRDTAPDYLSDILDRFTYSINHSNASTLAQRVIVNGQIVEPLAAAIRETRMVLANNEVVPMPREQVKLYEKFLADLLALRAIALARNPRSLKKALLAYAKLHPGAVTLRKQPYEKIADKVAFPEDYIWGTDPNIATIFSKDDYAHTAVVRFSPGLAAFIAATAQDEYMRLKLDARLR